MALSPTAAAAPTDDDTAGMPATDETVLVTISKTGDGTYMVYKGDEPEPGGEQTNGDVDGAASGASVGDMESAGAPDDAAMPAGTTADEASPQGQQAQSVGEALKLAMTILHDDESGGDGGAEGAFQSGFGGDSGSAATPVPMAQKY